MNSEVTLILASSSPFRRELLKRLGVEFSVVSPDIDETPGKNEDPKDLVTRLAQQKAEKIAEIYQDSIIIASDQVACLGGEILGKPQTHTRALEQLKRMRGNTVQFLTSLYVFDVPKSRIKSVRVDFPVKFRRFSDEEIERYLLKESPYQCAGSFKSEKLGITLVEAMAGEDPTALVGLPLIKLSDILRELGLKIP